MQQSLILREVKYLLENWIARPCNEFLHQIDIDSSIIAAVSDTFKVISYTISKTFYYLENTGILLFVIPLTSFRHIGFLRAELNIPIAEKLSILCHIFKFDFSLFMLSWPDGEFEQVRHLLSDVPSSERAEVICCTHQLISGYNNPCYRIKLGMLQRIIAIPADQREDVIRYAVKAANPNKNDPGILGRANIATIVATIPTEQRADVIRYAVQVFTTPHMDNYYRAGVIRELCRLQTNDDRAQYVAQELMRWGNLRGINQRSPDLGIDVHAEGRDDETAKTIQLLRKHQGNITDDKITLAVNNFTDYIKTSSFSEDQQTLALAALYDPKKPGEAFGPLIIDDTEFTVNGLKVSGKELIGRLWIFVSNLTQPEDKLAKTSMVSALIDSYEDGERVCNQGKTQRLLVGVLQGRLENVNIDKKPTSEQLLRHAENLFFTDETHRNINNLKDLLVAAEKFCEQNPEVKKIRTRFIAQIRAYAVLLLSPQET